MYPIVCTHLRLHRIWKQTQFHGDLYATTDKIYPQTHNCDNDAIDRYFRFDVDDGMNYKYILLITLWMGQLNTHDPIYDKDDRENKRVN